MLYSYVSFSIVLKLLFGEAHILDGSSTENRSARARYKVRQIDTWPAQHEKAGGCEGDRTQPLERARQ